jgi:hypothetical protein
MNELDAVDRVVLIGGMILWVLGAFVLPIAFALNGYDIGF